MKIFKKTKTVILAAALLVSLVCAGAAVSAYDGTADPIISLSYLKQYKVTEIDPQIAALQSRVEALEATVAQLTDGGFSGGSAASGADVFTVLQLQYGQKIVCGESCELILRAGGASVVLSASSLGGISDLTGAKDLQNGQPLTPNHLLLVPRNDGRGVIVTSDSAFIMVRGDYYIE